MNLLALLERRPPPEIPPGVARFYSSDHTSRPSPIPEEGPRENNRLTKQRENRNLILDAIKSGLTLIKEIEQRTGLCKSSIFNHTNILAAEGLIVINRGKAVNTFTLPKPKKSKRGRKWLCGNSCGVSNE